MRRWTDFGVYAAATLLLVVACGERPEAPEAPDAPPGPDAVEAPRPPDGETGPPQPGASEAPGPSDAADPPGPLPFPVPHSRTGDLLLRDGALAFLPCGSEDPVPLRDRTGSDAVEAVEELGYGTGRVLVAVVLDGDDLTEVRYAVPEGPGCHALLPEAELTAWGNEPFWSLRIEDGPARWITPDDMDGAVHAPVRWEAGEGGSWTLTAPAARGWEGEGPGGPLTLRVTPERCLDTMSGARFPFAVRVERDGREWTGCAVEGRGPAGQSGEPGNR